MNNRYHFNKFLSLVTLVAVLSACQKDKFDITTDNRMITDNIKSSNVRIVNLSNYNQVVVNGDSITSFHIVHPQATDVNNSPGTRYFPKNGRLGSVWTIPQELFDVNEKAEVTLMARNYYQQLEQDETILVENDYRNPVDYYLTLHAVRQDGQPASVKVPRDITAPSKPDHFKIRIINLTAKIRSNYSNSSGSLENLEGNCTLAFADGTPVNAKTTGITVADPVSEYIELPYGTYQFKVLTDDGRQILSADHGPMGYTFSMVDPPTSTLATSMTTTTNLVFAPVRTYEPGGIYTIVVTPQEFNYFINEISEDAELVQNAFRIIEDNSVDANMTYCRVQGVNALNNDAVVFKVNGRSISGHLNFGVNSEYTSLVHGNYTIEATDVSGKVIAVTSHVLRASMNYTFWLYPGVDGNPQVLVVSNDLTGKVYRGAGDDATYAYLDYSFFGKARYLNLSPDNAYITFTMNNGQPLTGNNVAVNLEPGVPVYNEPYAYMNYRGNPYEIMIYRSWPDVVPGTWASEITTVSSQNTITRKELYTNVNRKLPSTDIGIYTFALIGRNNASVPAKIMILKHNQ